MVPPHVSFQYHSEPIDDCFEIYWIHFSGSHAGRYLEDCGLSGSYFYPTRRMEELIVSIQTMTRELTFRQPNFENVTQSQLMYVLALTSRYYVSDKYATKNIDSRMQKVMEYIYLWYAKDLSLNELAEVASLSVSRFSSLFKQTFGLYPLQYIINYRIKRACDLLRHTEYSITTIAEMVGFEDPLYFSRVFKKQMNVNPTLYRQKMNPELFVINLMK